MRTTQARDTTAVHHATCGWPADDLYCDRENDIRDVSAVVQYRH